jgi:hypothetical protein
MVLDHQLDFLNLFARFMVISAPEIFFRLIFFIHFVMSECMLTSIHMNWSDAPAIKRVVYIEV